MALIDTHCHLSADAFGSDFPDVLRRFRESGVSQVISIGCNLSEAEKTISLVENNDDIFGAVGLHPSEIKTSWEEDLENLKKLSAHQKIVAVGEIGLDLYWKENPPLSLQIEVFEKQFLFACEIKKPVIIHMRSAESEMLSVLKRLPRNPFVMHCFSGDSVFAEEILSLGGFISFAGNITYPKNTMLQEVAKSIPLDRLMVETDSPYLAPQKWRGTRSEPVHVCETAGFIASLRNISFDVFSEATTANARTFFCLLGD